MPVFMSMVFALFYQALSLSRKFQQSRELRVKHEARIIGMFYFRSAL